MEIRDVELDTKTQSADIELGLEEEIQAIAIACPDSSTPMLKAHAIVGNVAYCGTYVNGSPNANLFHGNIGAGKGAMVAVPEALKGLPLRICVINAPGATIQAIIKTRRND